MATSSPRHTFQLRHKHAIIAVAIAAIISGIVIFLESRYWPFERGPVLQDLSEASDSEVTARRFQKTYFPSPGCIVEGITFRHGKAKVPLITIEKLIVKGSYSGILTHHLNSITALGMHVTIPPADKSEKFNTQPSTLIIGEIVADNSSLEFTSHDAHRPALRFEIHHAAFREVASARPFRFDLKVHIPTPPGEVETSGQFGAWKSGGAGETPVSGQYTFRDADLGHFGGIGGILSSDGKYEGTLEHINISGNTDVPDFYVKSSGHKFHLTTKFDAYVDGTRGDTFLKHVEARLGRTPVIAEGSVAGVAGRKGKWTKIELSAPKGRIDDVLGLFAKERAPMSGQTAMHANVEIPPGNEPFLRKVKLEGSFGIDAGRFTKENTQTDVDKLSAGARGENKEAPATVATDLSGRVSLNAGVANFSELSFEVPGVNAHLQGTYNVINHRINLHGPMSVDTKISKTTSGVKSFFLKVLDPMFKKKRKGEIVPVHIGGTYEHPQFGLDLQGNGGHNKAGSDGSTKNNQ
ncbi:MAG TPA: hypothetical protein VFO39_05930 [Candidatus Sulfotelmatobacter sp.]|nr:hypothetical protein [Candidatus Sulfotelmatobacter sp.]